MAAYPTLPIGLDSDQELESSWSDQIAESGTLHSRQLRSTQYYRFVLRHPAITEAQYSSLLATFAAGPRDTHTLTYREESPVATYTVTFLGPPQITKNYGNGRYDVRADLRGTKD